MIMENELMELVLNGKNYELDAYLENTSTADIRKDVMDILTRGDSKEIIKSVIKNRQGIIGE